MKHKRYVEKKMFIILSLLLLIWVSLGESVAETHHEPSVEIQLSKKESLDSLYRGEKFNFYVKILSPGIFAGAPRIELPSLSSGLLYQVQGRPVLGTENIEGQNYTSQLYEMWFFPKISGEITIPEMSVTFSVSESGSDNEKQYTKTTTPFTLYVKPIPEVADDLPIIVTDSFDVSQSFKPELKEGITGDAVVRTVAMKAKNMAAIFLPEIVIPKIQGVSVYREPPEVNDRNQRGEATAERKDVITYVFEAEGDYTIADISLTWWNSDSQTITEKVLPGFTAKIGVNPHAGDDSADSVKGVEKGTVNLKFLGFLVIVCVVAGWIGYRNYKKITDYLDLYKKQRAQSEKAYFQTFKKACDKNDPAQAYNKLYLWYQKKYENKDLYSFVQSNERGSVFKTEFDTLNRLLFDESEIDRLSVWNGNSLYMAVREERKNALKPSRKNSMAANYRELNY